MAIIEAVLTYKPGGLGLDLPAIPLGLSAHPRVLRVLRDILIEEAEAAFAFWEPVDPGVAALHRAEADRMRRILCWLLPDDEPRTLRLVKPEKPME